LAQVTRNKGAAGVDGMTVGELPAYLKKHWPTIRAQLLEHTYKPQPVRRVEIPKASGGKRLLGIPTVLDRFIQQAMIQVLQADWDGTFSETSFGFRPGRSAHQAVERAQTYIASGHAVVVDIDLEKFFDRVNHDILMGLVAKRVADKRLLKLIRGFLTAGVLEGGLVSPTEEGTPQGGPLSPLLSNLMLDVLDKELEKRGHRFVRYADDCNIYMCAVRRRASGCWPGSNGSSKSVSSSRSTKPRVRSPNRAFASSWASALPAGKNRVGALRRRRLPGSRRRFED
jgi:RNA-directed DNA polymerase